MKVLFTSDLHGKKHLYQETASLAVQSGADCIILGGDLFPTHVGKPLGLITGNADFQEGLTAQYRFIDEFLAPFLDQFMKNHPHVRLVYTPGNHDWYFAIERMKRNLPDAVCLHLSSSAWSGITFFGYGCVTDSSFWVKDYARRDRKEDLPHPSRYALVSTETGLQFSRDGDYAWRHGSIEEELSPISIPDPSRTVCIFHCPPYDTGLDTLYNGKPIGSRSVRVFIERHQPLVSLHGHIHESPSMSGFFSTRLGTTLGINPGHSSRRLHAVVFDTEKPEESLTHSVYQKGMPGKDRGGAMFERYGRKIKSLFMQKALSRKT
jgi:Icc-related predicted phosphoesterase